MTYSDTQYLRLYASCELTKGASRSAIHDLDRVKSYLIPNAAYDLLSQERGFAINHTLRNHNYSEVILNFINFILDEKIGFLVDGNIRDLFIPMPLKYETPFQITNIIIDVADLSLLEYFISDNSLAFVQTVQLRVYNPEIKINDLLTYLMQIENKAIDALQLIVPQSIFKTHNDYLKLIDLKKIDLVIFSEAKENINIPDARFQFFFISKAIDDHSHCGRIADNLFSIGIVTYTESQQFNTCLNRKIAIDTNGEIKNCPSMAKSYGNIRDTNLSEVAVQSGFQKFWHLKKDEITKCKDCEFRHICTDCRAYTDNPDDLLSAPLKCGYNPYTTEWTDWAKNPLKQQAIAFYEMSDLAKS